MAIRDKTIKHEEPLSEPHRQRWRPDLNQFALQVDRQTKSSYETFDAAETAGKVIKKKFPLVRVSVYDSVTHTNTDLGEAAAPSPG